MKKVITLFAISIFTVAYLAYFVPIALADVEENNSLFEHINTGIIAYTNDDIHPVIPERDALRFEYGINFHDQFVADLKTINPGLENYIYSLWDHVIIGSDNQIWMENWCAENNIDPEELYLHYAEETRVTINGETWTIPGWDTHPNAESRVVFFRYHDYKHVFNLANENLQACLAARDIARLQELLESPNGNPPAQNDGVHVDECPLQPWWHTPEPGYSGNIRELDGNYEEERAQFYADALLLIPYVQQALASEGFKTIFNTAGWYHTDHARAQTALVDGVLLEYFVCPISPYPYSESGGQSKLDFIKDFTTPNGKLAFITNNSGIRNEIITKDDDYMFTLAFYYLVHSPYTVMVWNPDAYSNIDDAWREATRYDVGEPQDDYYLFEAVDQPLYWLYDNGNIILEPHTANILAREFENALVLLKPKLSWRVVDTSTNGGTWAQYEHNFGDASTTTHVLPITPDNPTGEYYQLYADGSIDGYPVVNVDLKLGRGAILIKASSLVPQPDTNAPYITNLNPADGQVDVPVDTNISLNIIDIGAGVNEGSIQMMINGQDVTGDLIISGNPTNYAVVYDPPVDFSFGETIIVQVGVADLANPPNPMDEVIYTFTIESEPLSLTVEPTGEYENEPPHPHQGEVLEFRITVNNSTQEDYDGTCVISCYKQNEDTGEWTLTRQNPNRQYLGTPTDYHIDSQTTREHNLVLGVGPNVEPGRYKLRAYLKDSEGNEVTTDEFEGTVEESLQAATPTPLRDKRVKRNKGNRHIFAVPVGDVL